MVRFPLRADEFLVVFESTAAFYLLLYICLNSRFNIDSYFDELKSKLSYLLSFSKQFLDYKTLQFRHFDINIHRYLCKDILFQYLPYSS
jgi:hypothetical protein